MFVIIPKNKIARCSSIKFSSFPPKLAQNDNKSLSISWLELPNAGFLPQTDSLQALHTVAQFSSFPAAGT